jgi:hypothetical protein
MHLEASTKLHVHKKIHEFLIDMAFTMAYPNFKTSLKMAFGPLGINIEVHIICENNVHIIMMCWGHLGYFLN